VSTGLQVGIDGLRTRLRAIGAADAAHHGERAVGVLAGQEHEVARAHPVLHVVHEL
jgi:hypothetical protein